MSVDVSPAQVARTAASYVRSPRLACEEFGAIVAEFRELLSELAAATVAGDRDYHAESLRLRQEWGSGDYSGDPPRHPRDRASEHCKARTVEVARRGELFCRAIDLAIKARPDLFELVGVFRLRSLVCYDVIPIGHRAWWEQVFRSEFKVVEANFQTFAERVEFDALMAGIDWPHVSFVDQNTAAHDTKPFPDDANVGPHYLNDADEKRRLVVIQQEFFQRVGSFSCQKLIDEWETWASLMLCFVQWVEAIQVEQPFAFWEARHAKSGLIGGLCRNLELQALQVKAVAAIQSTPVSVSDLSSISESLRSLLETNRESGRLVFAIPANIAINILTEARDRLADLEFVSKEFALLQPAIKTEPTFNAQTDECFSPGIDRPGAGAFVAGIVSELANSAELRILQSDAHTGEQKMRRLLAINAAYAGKKSPQWEKLLGVKAATIRDYATWKEIAAGQPEKVVNDCRREFPEYR